MKDIDAFIKLPHIPGKLIFFLKKTKTLKSLKSACAFFMRAENSFIGTLLLKVLCWFPTQNIPMIPIQANAQGNAAPKKAPQGLTMSSRIPYARHPVLV